MQPITEERALELAAQAIGAREITVAWGSADRSLTLSAAGESRVLLVYKDEEILSGALARTVAELAR